MNFSIECEEEVDGRWIAEVPQLPGVLCSGKTADEAMLKAEALALRAMAERLEYSESRPVEISISLPHAGMTAVGFVGWAKLAGPSGVAD